ncbi:MAG: tetratricopeptide repeat protein [Chloroflexi bacterium]|nr:tetratricopeptide repeat protein [Chloroflexota bacterium]
MPTPRHIFVGRKNELKEFRQELGRPGLIARALGNPARNVKPRVFLPFGIGGIGKTELSRQCLQLAEKAGWQTLTVEWDRVGPVEPVDMMNAIALALQGRAGESAVQAYLDDRKKAAPTRERVQRYRTDHPEEWQRLAEKARQLLSPAAAAMPDPATKTLTAAIPAMIDYGPHVMAKAYDLLVEQMEKRKLLQADEVSLFNDTDARLAHQLVSGLVSAAKVQGLVVLLDTCEALPPPLEEFLRDSIVCPAAEQGRGLIFIVAGRHNQFREREIADADGARRSVKGYADRLTDPPPIVWDLSQFADPEVADYLRDCGLDPTPERVAFIQQTARGVPFAVQLVAYAVLKLGPERVKKDFPPADPAELNLQQMVVQVVRRFLHHCLDEQDEARVRALAILRARDLDAIGAVWQLSPGDSPRRILSDFEARYGFVEPGGTLHEVVRDFLREDLRGDDRENAHRLGALAADHYRPRWEAETAALPTLADRAAEDRWRALTLDLFNALCWCDETAAVRFLAGRAVEMLEFRLGSARALLGLAREFRAAPEWWATRSRRHFDAVARAVEGEGAEEMAGLDELQGEAAELGLDAAQRCVIHLWRASNLTGQGRAAEALNVCLEAEKTLPADESLRRALALRYAEAGNALGFKRGEAVPSPEAKTAYERAVALDPNHSGYRNNRGNTYAALKDYAAALADYTRAIELQPDYAKAFYNRGNTHHKLKDYAAALADYTRALDLQPDDADAFSNRGVTYRDLKDYAAALADYTRAIELQPDLRAIELQPDFAQAFSNRGSTYAELKDYAAALADYTRAIELQPDDAKAFYNRGITHRALKDYAAALADYTRAIELQPDDPWFYNALASLYDDQRNYPLALEAYGKAIEIDPGDARFWSNSGLTHYHAADYDAAVADFAAAIERNPKRARYYSHRGLSLCRLGRQAEGRRDFEQALALEVDNNVFTDLAARDVIEGSLAEAITHLRKAVELDPADTLESIKEDRDFDPVRETAEFREVVGGV